jgi:hypothetical protein
VWERDRHGWYPTVALPLGKEEEFRGKWDEFYVSCDKTIAYST